MQLAMLLFLISSSIVSSLAFLLLPDVINAWLNRRAEASVTAVASKAKQLRAKRRAQRQEVASGRANNSCVSSGSEEKDQACTTDDTSQDVASTLTNSFARTRVSDQDDGPMDVLIMVSIIYAC